MANEFIARKGIISLDDAQITGSLSVTNNISASIISGSFRGDGSQLTGISAGFPYTGSAEITGSLKVTGSISTDTDATINSLTVGKGGGNLETNMAVGYNALTSNTGGNFNVAIGYDALASSVVGDDNVAVGYNALSSSLASMGPNTAIGRGALQSNTYGFRNTAVGNASLISNTSGATNTAVGNTALVNNTVGNQNVAVGDGTLNDNIGGDNNTGIGTFSLHSNTDGNNNTGIGHSALYNNLTGSNNTVIGTDAGYYAGSGFTSLESIDNSILLGFQARALNATGDTNEIVIGYNVVGSGSNTTVIGNNSTVSTTLKGAVSASIFSGSFVGDGSQLSGIEGFPFTGSAGITGSLTVVGPVNATSFTGSLQGTATSASYIQLANIDGFTAYSASVNTAIDSVLDATTPLTATVNTGSSPFTLTSQSIVVADSTDGNLTINLPDLNAIVGTPNQKPIIVYKNDYSQNVIYVQPSGSQLVNGASQDIIVSIQLAVIYNPTSAGWVTEGTSAQSLAELELFFLPLTETGSLATTGSNTFIGNQTVTGSLTVTGGINATITGSATSASYVEYTNVANKPALVSGSSQIFAGYDYEIHVSQVDGNDTTGNGDLLTPVASITKALTLTTSSRKTIIVHPGTYSENITVGTTNTTIATSELTGANTLLSGTLTIGTSGSGTRISGLKMTNLVISGTAQAYISNCTIDDQVTKSSSGYVEIINSEMQCTSGIQISGAGTTIINGNKNVGIAVSNASAQVIIKGCNSVVTPSASAGNLAIVDCIVTALGGNGITITGASTTLTLLNSQVLVQAGNNVAPISVAGIYSIINTIYDKPGSTLTGTSTDSVDYFQYINADNITSTNGLTVTGSLTVTGQVVAQTLNVQQVTSSIVFSSGSNIFGNDLGNTQQFTGSLQVSGSSHYVLGNMGIGTITPLSRFHVNTGTNQNLRVRPGTDVGATNGVALNSRSDDDGTLLQLALRASDVIMLPSGNVGIGTASPNYLLDLWSTSATLRIRNITAPATGGTSSLLFEGINDFSGTSQSFINSIQAGNSGATQLVFGTSGTTDATATERLRITSGGNVGIGTDSPNTKLQVEDGFISTYHNINANSAGYGVQFFTNGGGSKNTIAAIEISQLGTARSGAIIFSTSDAGAPSPRMTITSGGNVGIGTTSVSGTYEKLAVAGGISIKNDNNAKLEIGRYSVGVPNSYIKLGPSSNSLRFTNNTDVADLFIIENGGNVGIGTNSPNLSAAAVGSTVLSVSTSTSTRNSLIEVNGARTGNGDYTGYLRFFNNAAATPLADIQAIRGSSDTSGDLAIATSNTERMRITSGGNVLIGKQVTGEILTNGFEFNPSTNYISSCSSVAADTSGYFANTATSGTRFLIRFYGTSSEVGRIQHDGTNTSYVTSSDYRLKEDLKEVNGLDKVSAIKIYDFKWKNSDNRMDGVIAHELAEVLPYAVSGDKDEVEENGSIKVQGVDYSKIVPILIKAIQEQQAQIESLKAEIQTLKQ
jgi:hypothetical protein